MTWRLPIQALIAFLLALQPITDAAEPEAVSEYAVSPDERFAIERVVVWANEEKGEATEESPFFRVIERTSKRVVTRIPEKGQAAASDEAKFIWAPDSKRFAWNYRGRGREETTELFQYNPAGDEGGKFSKLEQPSRKLASTLVTPEHARQLKALNLPIKPKDIVLRDIWDSCRVIKWIDAEMAELRIHSKRHVQNVKTGEVPVLDAQFQVTLRFDRGGKWKAIKSERVAEGKGQSVPD